MTSIDTSSTTNTQAVANSVLNVLDELDKILQKTQNGEINLPEANSELAALLKDNDIPSLTVPLKPLSLDTLLEAIGDEDRKSNVKSAVDKIKTDGDQMKAKGEEKLEQIKKRLEEMRKSKFLKIFETIFKAIAVVVGAIAAVGTIALGAATGNPLLVAAGIMAAIATIDSIVDLASDGKYSIAAGFTELGKCMGMSDEAAQWFGFGINMAFTVATIAVSFGAAASAASKIADTTKVVNFLAKLDSVSNIVSGVNQVGMGATGIARAVINYNVAQTEIATVDIDALLEQLREAIKRGQEFVEAEMEKASDILSRVKDIVQDTNETTTAVVTADMA